MKWCYLLNGKCSQCACGVGSFHIITGAETAGLLNCYSFLWSRASQEGFVCTWVSKLTAILFCSCRVGDILNTLTITECGGIFFQQGCNSVCLILLIAFFFSMCYFKNVVVLLLLGCPKNCRINAPIKSQVSIVNMILSLSSDSISHYLLNWSKVWGQEGK